MNSSFPARLQNALARLGVWAVLLAALFGGARAAQAATFIVYSTFDNGPGTLRQAITDANAAPGDDTIVFITPGTPGAPGTIQLSSALPALSSNIIIAGPGASSLTVRRNSSNIFRIFIIPTGVTVSIRDLTIAGGNVYSDTTAYGGGVNNGGNTTLENCVVTGNRAVQGGGISNYNGNLTLTGCTVSGNIVTVRQPTGPARLDARGGGLYSEGGTVSISRCLFSNNSTTATASNFVGQDRGGGLYNNGSSVTVDSSTFSGNYAFFHGGGIFNTSGGTLTLTNSTFSGNSTDNDGGGLHNSGATATANVTQCTFDSNVAALGGGLFNDDSGVLSIHRSTISRNQNGGAIGYGVQTLRVGGSVFLGDGSGSIPNLQGSLSLGYNVSNDGNELNKTGDRPGADVRLDTLKDNGGPTQTVALLAGSAAINAGDPAVTGGNDQRGASYARVSGPRVDAGAFEATYVPVQQLVVTTVTDEDNGNADPGYGTGTSLREALAYAATLSNAVPPPATTPEITFSVSGTITLTRGQLNIGTDANTGTNVKITGPGAGITLDGNTASRVFNIAAGTVSMSGLKITGGRVTFAIGQSFGNGGGISNNGTLTLSSCTVSGNATGLNGGGIFNTGVLTVRNSTLSGNTARLGGGGIFNTGTLTVRNSTLSGNTAQDYSYGNTANDRSDGGGAADLYLGNATFESCTLTGNSAPNAPGGTRGGILLESGTLSLSNCIVANNGTDDLNQTGGTLSSNGTNIVRNPTNVTGLTATDKIGVDPKLDTLKDNGGPTKTHALLADSPAINAGSTTLTTDQRGIARPQYGRADVGAYEFNGTLPGSLVVTTIQDENDGTSSPLAGTGTSLREALAYAATLSSAVPPPATTPEVTFGVSGTITLSLGQLNIGTNVKIIGPNATGSITVDGNTASRVFNITAGTVSISGLTIANGQAASYGGGIFNSGGTLSVTSCTLSGNSALNGGGIYNSGTLSVTSSTLSGNSAPYNGGSIFNSGGTLSVTSCTLSGNSANYGGGIINYGTLSVTSSTLSGNSANFNGGSLFNYGTLSVTSSTLSGNSANFGGGIFNSGGLTVTSSTLSGNSASISGGGIYNINSSSSVSLSNTLLAKGASGANYVADSGSTLTSNGYNLSDDATGPTSGTGDRVSVANLNLGTLQDNGGPTKTIALLAGSAAINAGDPAVTSGFDQRGAGYARVKYGRADVGAYEFNGTLPGSLVVTTTADENDSTSSPIVGTGTSLREALAYAATLSGTPIVTFRVSGTITLSLGQLTIGTNVKIKGPDDDGVSVSGGGATRVFNITAGAVALEHLRIIDGKTNTNDDSGAGIFNAGDLTLTLCVLSGNSTEFGGAGGAIFNDKTARLTLANCTFKSNSAGYGGAIFNNSDTFAGGTSRGVLSVAGCTFAGNVTAAFGGGVGGGGGALYARGTVTLFNSTFAGNTAGAGGGVYNDGGALAIKSCTIVNNSSTYQGGGLQVTGAFGGTASLNNTLIAGNSAPQGPDAYGGAEGGFNLVQNASGFTFYSQDGRRPNLSDVSPGIGDLASNGGPTQTVALLPGSPAINAGDPALTGTDQRGVTRPLVRKTDIGAYELDFTPDESLTVTTLQDEDNGTSDPAFGAGTSLREAIFYANSRAVPSTITFAANVTGTLDLDEQLPPLTAEVTLQGPGAAMLAIDGYSSSSSDAQYGIFQVNSGASVRFNDLTLTHVYDDFDGGALRNLGSATLTNCVISRNRVLRGGGVFNAGGTLVLRNCTFISNRAESGEAVQGSALYSVGGGVSVENCTFTANENAVEVQDTAFTATNSTWSGNVDNTQGEGANTGAFFNGSGTSTLLSCTFAGNTATAGALNNAGTLTLSNTIVAGTQSGPDIANSGTLGSGGYNLVGTGEVSGFGGAGDVTGVTLAQLNLGALSDNGGPTKTRALGSGSLAINAGDPAVAQSATSFDQRGEGYARVIGGRLDVGAYESQNLPPLANAQSVALAQDTSRAITLTGSGGTTYAIASQPRHGTLTGTGANVTYVPAPGYVGPDDFTFTVSDGTLSSAAAQVSLSVTASAVNHAPICVGDSKSTDRNVALTFPATDLTANDSAGEGDVGQSLVVTQVGSPSSGTVTLGNDGTITFVPAADFAGTATFSYTVTDDGQTNGAPDPMSATGTVNVTVNAVNQGPSVAPIPPQNAQSGTPFSYTPSASDPESNGLVWSLVDGPAGLSIDAGTGEITWTPTLAQVQTAPYGVTVQVTDDGTPTQSSTANLSITVSVGAGGTDGGTTNSGTTNSGTTSSGTTNSGTTNSGSTDSGATNSGTTNSGGTDSGATNSGATNGGTTNSGTTNSGTTNSGTTNSGTTNSGSTDSGATNSGTTNSGATNSGTTNSGGTDSGATNSGATNSGSTNSGTTNGGTTNSGTTNSGTTNGGTTNSGATNSGGTNSGATNSGATNSGATNSGSTTLDPEVPGAGLKILKKAEKMYSS